MAAAASASTSGAGKLAETGALGLGAVAASGSTLAEFNVGLAACEKLLPLVGQLYRKNVIVALCKVSLAGRAPLDIMRLHEYAGRHFDGDIRAQESLAIVQALASMSSELSAWRFDIGFARSKLAAALSSHDPMSDEGQAALVALIRSELEACERSVTRTDGMDSPTDVVLYGHGRIGRLLNRMLVEKSGGGGKLVLRAIVVRQKASTVAEDLEKRASLLKKDSVHGDFEGTVAIDVAACTIVANGNPIRVIYAAAPEDVDYTAYGIHDAIILDNTGAFRTREALERHIRCPGAKTAILTAPASGGGVPTIVAGVNDDRVVEAEHIFSAASCTTNAIAPVLKLLHDTCGIESGHIETVHAFTNDQHLVDGMHKKSRRGRSAALNMVPTETGAAKAVVLAVPELAGILTASAIRVPTPNVSMALLILRPARRPVSADRLYSTLKGASIAGPLHNQIDFSEDRDAVSTDFVGSRAASVIDWPASIVTDDRVVIKAWYDNEAGYSAQVVRLVQKIAGISFPDYPATAPEVLLSPKLKPVSEMCMSPPPLPEGSV